jgi:hypothetical protein
LPHLTGKVSLAGKPPMKVKILRPRPIQRLARVPGLNKLTLGLYDAWLRFSYRRLWNWNNTHASRAFALQPPRLTAVQERIVRDLRQTGFAHVPFVELFQDQLLWNRLDALVQEWLASEAVQQQEKWYRETGYKEARFKEYLVRWYGRESDGKLIPWDSAWLQLALHPKVLDIANSYFQMFTRMYHVDVWNTIAMRHDGPLIGPQRWHRDPADVKLLKCFLYFSDVDASSGAMQYVPYSRPGEKYGSLWPQDAPFDGARPPDGEFAQYIPPSEWITAAFPKGTLVLADTAAFHRGGRAETHNRVLATWAYSSQASRWPRAFRVDPKQLPADLPEPVAWALSLRP